MTGVLIGSASASTHPCMMMWSDVKVPEVRGRLVESVKGYGERAGSDYGEGEGYDYGLGLRLRV